MQTERATKRTPPDTSGGRAYQEARKVHKRTISHPQNLPLITKTPQTTKNLPALTPRPQSESITKRPQQAPERHDYSHSGGRALNTARNTPEHKTHNELVKLARQIISAHANNPAPGVAGDTKGDAERATADAYKIGNSYLNALSDAQEAHGNELEAQAKRAKQAENEKALGSKTIQDSGTLAAGIPVGDISAGIYHTLSSMPIAKAVSKKGTIIGDTIGPTLAKTVANAGKELVDIPANVIPSTYETFKPAVEGALTGDWKKTIQGEKKAAKNVSEPYVNLYRHPGKTITEHPLSTALMVGGPLKAADRLAGRVEQRAIPGLPPKKPYEHIEIRLPGTAAKQVVLPRQGALAYRLQKSRKGDATRMSDHEINRRTNETFYTALNQSRQDAYDAIANHQHKNPKATPKELEAVAKTQLEKSRNFYRDQSALDMALRDKNGVVRKFHGGKFDDATKFIERWGQNLVNQGKDVKIGEYEHNGKPLKGSYHSADAHTLAPYVLKTGPNAGKTILAPKIAIDQLAEHDSYLKQTTTSAILQGVSGTFRRTVLPFSPKWLSNNYTEAALRGAINGIGPASKHTASKFYNDLSEGGKKEFNQLVKSVGHGGMQRQLLQEGTTWESKLKDTAHWKFGESLTKIGQMKGPKQARFLMDKWTDVAFHDLNGRMENQVHMGMAGKVLRRHPLMSKAVLDATHKAMNPEGKSVVEQRNNLVAMGREVDRMFGAYGKFSPAMRRSIATWTPFIPWTLNAVHFITQHLPNDHPIVTALVADAHQHSQEWRNKHGLGNFIDGKLPPFLQGAIPGSNGSHWMIFSQGTPFSVAGDPTGTLANNFNPLGSTIQANLQGLDWKGDKLKNDNPAVRLQTAILSALEGTTPIGYAANRLTGGNDGSGANLKKWANPFHPIKASKASKSGGSKKKAPGLFKGSGGGQPSLFHGGSGGSQPSLFGG